MSEQHLDGPKLDVAFQELHRKAVPQAMGSRIRPCRARPDEDPAMRAMAM